MTRRYFRIQPAGLDLNHLSETSSGDLADGLHVFWVLHQVLSPDTGNPGDYGEEVVILEADHQWPNNDVEGVCVDGATARLVARIPLAKFEEMAEEDGVNRNWHAEEFCKRFGI